MVRVRVLIPATASAVALLCMMRGRNPKSVPGKISLNGRLRRCIFDR